jgi:hypothetical protein
MVVEAARPLKSGVAAAEQQQLEKDLDFEKGTPKKATTAWTEERSLYCSGKSSWLAGYFLRGSLVLQIVSFRVYNSCSNWRCTFYRLRHNIIV